MPSDVVDPRPGSETGEFPNKQQQEFFDEWRRQKEIAADCWRRGNEAIAKENWDYGIQMYFTAVKLIPDNLMYRQSLRFTEYKKYNNNGSGATMASMRSMGSKGSVKKSRMTKNWQAVDVAAEEGLQVIPGMSALTAMSATRPRHKGFRKWRFLPTKRRRRKSPRTKRSTCSGRGSGETRRVQAGFRLLAANSEAGAHEWDRPLEDHLTRREGSDGPGGYEGAEGTGVMAPHEVARRMGTDGKAGGPGSSPIADMERAMRKDPTNRDQLMKLADLYRREGRLEDAEQQLLKSLELSGGNINVREVLEDVQLDLMRKAVTRGSRAVPQTRPTNPRSSAPLRMSTELLNREVEVIAARVERYPQDMRMKSSWRRG